MYKIFDSKSISQCIVYSYTDFFFFLCGLEGITILWNCGIRFQHQPFYIYKKCLPASVNNFFFLQKNSPIFFFKFHSPSFLYILCKIFFFLNFELEIPMITILLHLKSLKWRFVEHTVKENLKKKKEKKTTTLIRPFSMLTSCHVILITTIGRLCCRFCRLKSGRFICGSWSITGMV